MAPAGGTQYVFIEGTSQDSLDYIMTVLPLGGYDFSMQSADGGAWRIRVKGEFMEPDADLITYFYPDVTFRCHGVTASARGSTP
jgi:hypothetical protein